MIRKGELRLGNWIIAKETIPWSNRRVGQVTSIDYSGINRWQDHGAGGDIPFDEIVGVELTEDLLRYYPFEQGSVGSRDTTYHHVNFEKNGFFVTCFAIDGRIEWEGRIIKFVHHLQNIFIDVTGEELEIKL